MNSKSISLWSKLIILSLSVGSNGCANRELDSSGFLAWPIDCIPGETCSGLIGYPDINHDGISSDCNPAFIQGHEGTDIGISESQQEAGIGVYAAADGEVLWVFDGKFDKCPDVNEPDCQDPGDNYQPNLKSGFRVCTESGEYCGSGSCCCFWCFDGGNVIIIKHVGIDGLFATRYDHLKTNSISVSKYQKVIKGQKIAEVGSAGRSSGPHLHFEVWSTGFYKPVDPWGGECSNTSTLWENDPPWSKN